MSGENHQSRQKEIKEVFKFSFFNNLNLTKKLVTVYFSVFLLALLSLSITYYFNFKNALLDRTFAQLSSINMLEKEHIEKLFNAQFKANFKTMLDDIVQFDHLLYERTGMGETGETYIVDDQFVMRSVSRFLPMKEEEEIIVKTKATQSLANGNAGQDIIQDYRGIDVLSVYRTLNFDNGETWYIITEMDLAEAMIPVYEVRNLILWVSLYALIIIIFVTVMISTSISRPIITMKNKIRQLANGQMHIKRVKYEGKDELGEIADSINQLIESLERVVKYTKALSSGEFEVYYKPLSDEDEFGMNLSLTKYRLMETIERNEKLEKENKKALLKGQEKERIRLAKELHDSIGALLTTTKFTLSSLKDNEEEKAKLKQLLDQTIQEVRAISFNIMPGVLVDFGIVAAVKALISQFEGSERITFNFEENLGENERFDRELEINVYRIFQEAINNIIKHAKAEHVELNLSKIEGTLILFIEDDGIGFQQAIISKRSNGLTNIRERISLLNGQVSINSTENGTTIEAEIPLNNE